MSTITQVITTLPDAPSRADPASFPVKSDTFVAALPGFGTQMNTVATQMNVVAGEVNTNASIASQAAGAVAQVVGTSTTSVTVGTGAKSLTTQASKSFVAGQTVAVVNSVAPTTYMVGTITSYDSGSGAIVVEVTSVNGSGTATTWSIFTIPGTILPLQGWNETVNARGSISGAQTIDCASGTVVTATITGATTFTFSNSPATGRGGGFVLILTNGGAGAITWPGAVKWAGGAAPTLTTSGVDLITMITTDAGTTWRGVLSSKDSK